MPTMENSNEYSLFSPEKVYLKLNLAGVGSRFAASLIDGIFQGLLTSFLPLIVSLFGFWGGFGHSLGNKATALFAVGFMIIEVVILGGYSIFFETIWNGQTPGKRFIKIRVVQENGSPVTFLMVLIRNVLRVIDMLPFAYGIGMLAVMFSKKNQRLGDMAAGTVVVREKGDAAPAVVDFSISETPWLGMARLHIHEIEEEHFAVLKKYLLRRSTMKPEETLLLDQKLGAFFIQKLGLHPEEIRNMAEFLTQVAALYQHRS